MIILSFLSKIDAIFYASSIGIGIICYFAGRGAFKTLVYMHIFIYAPVIAACLITGYPPYDGPMIVYMPLWIMFTIIINTLWLHIAAAPFPWSADATQCLILIMTLVEQVIIYLFSLPILDLF
jgi:hypothetical protein